MLLVHQEDYFITSLGIISMQVVFAETIIFQTVYYREETCTVGIIEGTTHRVAKFFEPRIVFQVIGCFYGVQANDCEYRKQYCSYYFHYC